MRTDAPSESREFGVVRLAAVGDLHLTPDRVGRFRPTLLEVHRHADVLLLAGDLTERGSVAHAACLAGEVRELGLPVVAVLGNHDHLSGAAGTAEVAAVLADAGVLLLDNTGTVITVDGVRLGVGGLMGFAGGFDPGREADDRAAGFATVLAGLECDIRVALTHYSPTVATLEGEPRRLYSALGSSALGAAIDMAGVHLAVHGHAHRGREHGVSPGEVPVRNVAYPVIRSEARIYHLNPRPDRSVEVTTVGHDRVGGWLRWSSSRSVDLAARSIDRTQDAFAAATVRGRRGGRRG